MLKYVSKFVLESLPSVAATIVGAYIVNYYIVPRAAADRPAAALASTVASKPLDKDSLTGSPVKDTSIRLLPARTDADVSSDIAVDPAPAKVGIKPVEKAAADKATSDKATSDKATSDKADVAARRHQPASREKAATDRVAVRSQPAPVATPVVDIPAAVAADERRDANDLARAAIERLRVSNESPPRAQDAPRVTVVPAPTLQPLPPAIMVSTPRTDTYMAGPSALKPPYQPADNAGDSQRLRPPAEIPSASRPLDLRAEVTGSTGQNRIQQDNTTVADDVLSAAKSVFHAVLPK